MVSDAKFGTLKKLLKFLIGKKLVAALVSQYPGQRLSLQNAFLHKWVRKNYYEAMQGSQTANLEIRTEHKKEYEYEYKPLVIHRSQSEILVDNDYNFPTEKTTEGISNKTKYVFEPPKNKFVNTSDYLPSKVSVSTNDPHSSKKCISEFCRLPLRVTNDFKETMNLNSV